MEILEVGILLLGSLYRITAERGELAQLARALDLHSRGHRFDSDILHNQMYFCFATRQGISPFERFYFER